jgi:hypothetical protein
MKFFTFIILCLLTTFQINAQTSGIKPIEHGVLFGVSADSNNKLNSGFQGYGIEGGYYFLKRLSKRGMLSIDIRLAYAQNEKKFVNVIKQDGFFSFTDTVTTRTGIIDYKNLSIAFPIRYRFQLSHKLPLFLLAGINPYFSFKNSTTWNFDEFEYDLGNNIAISSIRNQEESLKQSNFNNSTLSLGFGYKKDKLMFDLYLSAGTVSFDNDFVTGSNKTSIVLNAYYQLH